MVVPLLEDEAGLLLEVLRRVLEGLAVSPLLKDEAKMLLAVLK